MNTAPAIAQATRPAGGTREIAPLYEQLAAFDIVDEWFEENADLLAECGGDLSDPRLAPLVELLDHVSQDFNDKVERCGLKLQADKAEVAKLDMEITRLTARRKAIENRGDRLKRYLMFCMTTAGRDKVKGLLCSVAVQQASNPSLTVQDPRQLPDALQTVVPETRLPNRDAILDAWKANGKQMDILLPEMVTTELGNTTNVNPLFPPAAGVQIAYSKFIAVR